jgi:hypothetical protein
MHWDLLQAEQDWFAARCAGARYLARLRAVLLAYHPLHVHVQMEFPRASAIFDGDEIDTAAVERVLDRELQATDIARTRLTGHIPR